MSKPKIAFMMQPFDKVLPPNQNSVGILVFQIARRLVPDFEVTVYMKNISYKIDDFYKYGIHFRAIPLNYDHQIRRFKKNPNEYKLFIRRYYPFYLLQTAIDIRRHPVDIVQIFNFAQNAELLHFLNPKVKIVLRMGCEWLSQVPEKANKFIDKIDFIIGCSQFITDRIEKVNQVEPARLQPVHNGVDITQFMPKNDHEKEFNPRSPKLLYVGRTSPEKGIHIMLEALSIIKDKYPGVKLTLVGGMHGQLPFMALLDIADDSIIEDLKKFYVLNKKDEYDDHLYSIIASKNLENNVIIAGEKSNHETIKYYQDADIFLFPTVCNEGFGIPVIEAMATGAPVVGSKTGGVTELIDDGITGYLVERNNVQVLANGVLKMLSDPEKMSEMGKNARQKVEEHFNWDVIVEDLKKRYLDLIADK
jgi:glycosyltransferase involved in cell wall biosynthesis